MVARLLALLVGVTLAGCGGNETLGQVTGTITLDGQPLADAFVIFAPTGGGTTSYGRTDEKGQYEMMFSDTEMGAWIGENKVEISTADVDATMSGSGQRERVPKAYNTETTLKVQVDGGPTEHNFDLKSDAGKIEALIEE